MSTDPVMNQKILKGFKLAGQMMNTNRESIEVLTEMVTAQKDRILSLKKMVDINHEMLIKLKEEISCLKQDS